MADLVGSKANVQAEDVISGAAASEATMQKIGSSINFWNSYFEGTRLWAANGEYSLSGTGADTGIDGAYFSWTNQEMYAVGIYNFSAGSSGTTEIDIVRTSTLNVNTSIFATRPRIPASAGDNARIIIQILPTYQVLFLSPGCTAPTFSSTNLTQGDMLKMNFVTRQANGRDCGVSLAIRPR